MRIDPFEVFAVMVWLATLTLRWILALTIVTIMVLVWLGRGVRWLITHYRQRQALEGTRGC